VVRTCRPWLPKPGGEVRFLPAEGGGRLQARRRQGKVPSWANGLLWTSLRGRSKREIWKLQVQPWKNLGKAKENPFGLIRSFVVGV
jgi:hypothetical protein